MLLFKPEDILGALAKGKGPMTYRMLCAAFGLNVIFTPRPSWWRRLWSSWERRHRERARDAASLDAMLADMVAVGQIVHSAGPPETWALPPEKKPAPAAASPPAAPET